MNITTLLKQLAAWEREGILEYLPKRVGQSYNALYPKFGDDKKVKVSTVEYIVMKCGYRLKMSIIDERGMEVTSITANPNDPVYTEEEWNARREKYASVDHLDLIAKKSAEKRGGKNLLEIEGNLSERVQERRRGRKPKRVEREEQAAIEAQKSAEGAQSEGTESAE